MGVDYSVFPLADSAYLRPFVEIDEEYLRKVVEPEGVKDLNVEEDLILSLINKGELDSWLRSHGIDRAQVELASRYPTPTEIRQVLDSLPPEGFETKYFVNTATPPHTNWDALISDEYVTGTLSTLLHIAKFSGDETAPHEFWFEKGAPWLNIYITEQISHVCGPLIIVGDDKEIPILVQPGADADELLKKWVRAAA